MKYMTFNSSCSYAGLANMLEHYGVDTDDRSIAMGMNLPYLFAYEDDTYMAGPMLQNAKWFNLFLNPIGLQMTETTVPAEELPCYLRKQKTAMLGLQVDAQNKHAVVYQEENDLAARFSIIQKQLLTVLRQDEQSVILLGDYFPVKDFEDNLEQSVQLIQNRIHVLQLLTHKVSR